MEGLREKLPSLMALYRARERVSQAELAKRCGVSAQTIYSVEKGRQDPSKQTMLKILMVVSPKEVFNASEHIAD